MKIRSVSKLRTYLSRLIDEDERFVTWDRRNRDFKDFPKDSLVICGEDHEETFYITITKVYEE